MAKQQQTSVSRTGAARPAFIGMALILLTGCAVHYGDSRSGVEHLWGFGQLRLESQPTGGGLAAVTTGVRVPGLCVEVGRDHFGFTFGYLDRQRLAVVDTNAAAGRKHPVASPRFCSIGSTNALWALGHLQMRTVPAPTHHYAIVTGKALAGLGASLGNQDNSLGLVLDGRQQAVVLDENILLDFDQDAPRWPGFDLFKMQVKSSTPDNPNQHSMQGEP
jgi:hypothetical protein